MNTSNEVRLSVVDRLDIPDLYGHYALTIDFDDGAGWVECFTSNGEFFTYWRGNR